MARNRTPKAKPVAGKAGKVVAKKVHPLILEHLKKRGIPVTAVSVEREDSVAIYNKSLNKLQESK